MRKLERKTKEKNPPSQKILLIIGGAGFIGINAARHFLMKKNWSVIIFDNLSRKGSDLNLAQLKKDFPKAIHFVKGDIVRDITALKREVNKSDAVIHLAAQVAVTTSVTDPRTDFEINALGTFNVLEAIRLSKKKPSLIYSSTNKVYGGLEDLSVKELKNRYEFSSKEFREQGVSEERNLDFHSPYGCSKGAADQYVIDYSRIYGLKTVVFRQSCIYGRHQFGVEDQGWVAWFMIACLVGRPITIYGNGKQIRDILFVDDLVDLYSLALSNIEKVSGRAYNIGAGPKHTISLIELLSFFKEKFGFDPKLSHAAIRPGDQPIFVCDIKKIKKDLGWEPKTNINEGLHCLRDWLEDNKQVLTKFFGKNN
ncbi:MAG: NAD-dependent epimerase/dehydratase family protein [Candidatus Harrisonbacteria bacterium]|nr:NAD-dependent epimerase/dehydratase family protein [Candidatus Harrisonbacteria bacterium]